ncbi:SEC-C metal-binding domain-containing protein [Streptomyces thioluteus]|uniref:SEC-C metal-binding domain-containing protein n=1 Tax=Streptomyces thioluteus TaxID=66431 RepID=UPI003CD09355
MLPRTAPGPSARLARPYQPDAPTRETFTPWPRSAAPRPRPPHRRRRRRPDPRRRRPARPCPCGSGRRYKACHGRAATHAATELVHRPFEGCRGAGRLGRAARTGPAATWWSSTSRTASPRASPR